MNPHYKPTFYLLFFIGTILTILGIILVFFIEIDTIGFILLGTGFFVQFINLILYYKKGKIADD